jgi:3-methyladenine DNA glycosylase/8-oxoguanine DNA glycosylase
MSNSIFIPTPENFSFRHAVGGHGWYDLAPFAYDETAGRLDYVYFSPISRRAEVLAMTDGPNAVAVKLASKRTNSDEAAAVVRHVLRLGEELDDFYSAVRGHEHFSWVEEAKAGRLLRSGTVFEDLVKTLCTTNCSWGLTKIMTANLVDKLGEQGYGGRKAFPIPAAIASMTEGFSMDAEES